MHSSCGYTNKTCTRTSQPQPQHRWGEAHKVPPLSGRLLAVDGCCWVENQFSSGMLHMKGCSCSTCLCTHAQIGVTRCSLMELKKQTNKQTGKTAHEVGSKKWWWGMGKKPEGLDWGGFNQNRLYACMKFSNNKNANLCCKKWCYPGIVSFPLKSGFLCPSCLR